ncbi:MAG TPA: hypothetical protein VKC54_03995 [Patescibacteria group bacterium]|nr:hypothetical protein [Patescibacteria group bacterium]
MERSTTDAPPPPCVQSASLIEAPAPSEYKHNVDYTIHAPPPSKEVVSKGEGRH